MSVVRRSPGFDWAAFETDLVDELRLALEKLAATGVRFRVVGLHGIEAQEDGLLSLPMLGADAERAPSGEEASFWSDRWTPDGWSHADALLHTERALRLEKALTAYATRGTQAQWRAVEKRYLALLVGVAGRLRALAAGILSVTDDFVVLLHDEEGGPDLAAQAMPEELVARFFAKDLARKAAQVAATELPAAERARLLVSRFGHFEGLTSEVAQRELVAMGEPAIEALLGALADPGNGWTAAMVLGKLGIARPDAIAALRANVGRQRWHAAALGMLGDHRWLLGQPREVAVPGLSAPLQAWSGPRDEVDYGPLGALLDAGDAETRKAVEQELGPGTSYCAITKRAVPSVLAGLESTHAVIRWHATSLLRERGLGAALGRRILPALAGRLDDPNAVVRRLAVLSIVAWKAASAPYRPKLEAMREDPSPVVRRLVASVLAG